MIVIPDRLASACLGNAERVAWLERRPKTIVEIGRRWSLSIGSPYGQATGSWVALATRNDGSPPTVRVLDSDAGIKAKWCDNA
ncbi:MAG TPA: hypothetical protein VM032_09285 [Vicinamibacterales bacterium]|nr:hypothetical protein [Vicinamibacterales bacterium]